MANNGKEQTPGTLMTTTYIGHLRKTVIYVKNLKKLVDESVKKIAEPISQNVLEVRNHLATLANETERYRKAFDNKLKEEGVVKDHEYPNTEEGTLSLNFTSSPRCGYLKREAFDYVQQLINNFVNNVRAEDIDNGMKAMILNLLSEQGLENIHKTLEKQFPPSTSESVKVK